MNSFENLTYWTIALSILIIVGAGHGIACLGLLELMSAANRFEIGSAYFSLSFTSPYDRSLSASVLFFFLGHLLLLGSIFVKGEKLIFWTKIVGLLFTWLGFLYLTHNLAGDNLSQIGFFTGAPYLVCSIILAHKVISQFRNR